ncbi:prenyltransferase/squalene oxidase repeat-containing protein [Curtobacterium sp. YR515]|uniref:prenyltransferase/squalene oxidase repeat-containing protein n=1 Tax=Curtobacterium sp. YR515 TaxID=1855316 RepID=UPI0008E298D6|nr:prenyltransferase/squalene oxidase repeat-containing protein [Curtobacterium sp. YR515]SFF62633.1 Prenyltransferase and squalene oxidase repeat-containing protein [Curtobacterium sp. YR515]
MNDTVVDWLLDSDPALRWQVERDIVGAPAPTWQATRARVATEGLGAALLARQDPDGQWAGGAYFPAEPEPEGPGQPYTATTWSLNALREWGLDAAVLGDTAARLDANSRWEYDDLPYWGGEVDCCINAFTLANGAWLGADVDGIADWVLEHQQPDGGWNCEWVGGSTVSSFHSTLNVLEGLLQHEVLTDGRHPRAADLRDARHRGADYLLDRRLLHRKSDGALVGPWATEFAYPFRWRYSVLRATDRLRAAALRDEAAPDPRAAEAIEVVRAARGADGRWRQGVRPPGRQWFEVDVPAGEPSRWLTLVGTRVLRWWDGV